MQQPEPVQTGSVTIDEAPIREVEIEDGDLPLPETEVEDNDPPVPEVEIEENHSPQILSVPVTASNASVPYFYPAQAIDPDGDELTWILETAPGNLIIDPQSGLLFGSGISPGVHTVSVKVEDGNGGSVEQTFTLSVNQNPVIHSIAPTYTFTGYPYIYQVGATSPDETILIYSLETAPSGTIIDPDTGSLNWDTPVAGEFEIAINITSAAGNSAMQEYTLTVLEADSLRIISEPVTTGYVSQSYRYQLSVLSLTETDKTYSLTDGAAGMHIEPATGLLTWVPDAAGNYTVEIFVLDADGRTGSQRFEIVVRSLEEMDRIFNEMIENIFASLAAGDIDNARLLLSGEAQAKYLPILNELLPYVQEITANLGSMERMSIDTNSAEYIIPRTVNGERRLFIVTFVRDPEGNWRLNSL